ncbi:hypothetical protein [Streptomyces bluensis]|uniref:hypothetical protein n=1 Tax=Streptomyces bluensis TaxID=33897 RepID=UPI00332AB402
MTTDSRNVADSAAEYLGGRVQEAENPVHGRLEVLAESSAVDVFVSELTGEEISFRLAIDPDLGFFTFSSGVWNREEISQLSRACDSSSVRGELALRSIEFKTRTGLTVLYVLPSIRLRTSKT